MVHQVFSANFHLSLNGLLQNFVNSLSWTSSLGMWDGSVNFFRHVHRKHIAKSSCGFSFLVWLKAIKWFTFAFVLYSLFANAKQNNSAVMVWSVPVVWILVEFYSFCFQWFRQFFFCKTGFTLHRREKQQGFKFSSFSLCFSRPAPCLEAASWWSSRGPSEETPWKTSLHLSSVCSLLSSLQKEIASCLDSFSFSNGSNTHVFIWNVCKFTVQVQNLLQVR